MFERYDVIGQYVFKSRIEQSIRKAVNQRVWGQVTPPSLMRQTIAHAGTALVNISTRLQTVDNQRSMRHQRI